MLSNQLRCIILCIFAQGGKPGGFGPVDRAVNKAKKDPPVLSSEDKERILTTSLGYFFANSPTLFSAARVSLWDCIRDCLELEGDVPPPWFHAQTSIVTIILKAGG